MAVKLSVRLVTALAVEADLSLVETPARVFDDVEAAIGPVTALVLSHCQSVDSDICGTTIASFDLHVAVNARASWLLVREFGRRFRAPRGRGRIIALTSDHTAGNLPYGAEQGGTGPHRARGGAGDSVEWVRSRTGVARPHAPVPVRPVPTFAPGGDRWISAHGYPASRRIGDPIPLRLSHVDD